MSTLFYPTLLQGKITVTPQWYTELVEYESGRSQRNRVRSAALLRFSLSYEILTATEYTGLLNFFHRHRGGYESFWFRDFTDLNPVARDFAVGDGATLVFKLPHDAMDTCSVYINAVLDPTAVLDLATGMVTFLVAPASGTRLTYSATNARYNVRFVGDTLESQRLEWGGWSCSTELVQVRDA